MCQGNRLDMCRIEIFINEVLNTQQEMKSKTSFSKNQASSFRTTFLANVACHFKGHDFDLCKIYTTGPICSILERERELYEKHVHVRMLREFSCIFSAQL